jgi:peptidoglycan LD-endopeptidase LytH
MSVYHPLVPFDQRTDRIVQLDLSEANTELNGEILSNTKLFSVYINDKLRFAKARYGIGGYGEKRAVYGRSELFNRQGDEPRRIHLGIDIWGKHYTKVMAPLEGIIHSFAFNDNFGDYGATLILSHIDGGEKYYTLYGHLSLNSIKNISEGDAVTAGDVIGEFGIPLENGHWPPHLHFQVIKDLNGWKGDYPGVCAESEKELYLKNCPDPAFMLGFLLFQ